MKFLSHLLEIRVFFQERLGEIGCAVGKLLQNLDALFSSQLLLIVSERQADKIDLAFFLAFELSLVCFVIPLHVLISDCDFPGKIVRAQPNKAHI